MQETWITYCSISIMTKHHNFALAKFIILSFYKHVKYALVFCTMFFTEISCSQQSFFCSLGIFFSDGHLKCKRSTKMLMCV